MKKSLILLLACFVVQISFAQDDLLKVLKSEADRNLAVLQQQAVPAYFISYRVYDTESYFILAKFGNLMISQPDQQRLYQPFVRVGSPELDNTHEIKGDDYGSYNDTYTGSNLLVMEPNAVDWKNTLWRKTDELYKNAVKQYEKVKANVAVKVASEDKSKDFTVETPEKYIEKPLTFKDVKPDVKKWEEKLKYYSSLFNENKEIQNAMATLQVELIRKYFVSTEGAEIMENTYSYRLMIEASTIADDGMALPLYKTYFAHHLKDLPSDEEVIRELNKMSKTLSDLRKAPVAESYSGPIMMSSEASGVFFHEIFGHRIEGARLKQETDAQTFKKKIGEYVLPKDFSLIFDPQLKEYKGFPLSGNYIYDDEGVKGQRVEIVKDGVLKSFLMSRTPIEGFSKSNGHGRGMIYYNTVTRQSNMLIESNNPKTEKELKELFVEELNKTEKTYGYRIEQVRGGFTTTGRYMPNAFNVSPLVVYRVYADGRPDELVRGVDLVGTPLSMFSQIAACGMEYNVFNGMCGAESGWVPVSCVSPSLFVKMVETQKQSKAQNQPPILERP